MKILLTFILSLTFFLNASAGITTKVFSMTGYGNYNVIIYTPDNSTGNLPAIIFFPGSGESTTNVNDLYINGPLHFIQGGWKPNFIVIGAQMNNGKPGPINWVKNVLDNLSDPTYRIDWNRWYMTGLSYGCGTIQGYIQGQTDPLYRKPTAIIPMSCVVDAQCGDFYANTDSLCGTDLRFLTIPIWGFCGRADSFYDKMFRFYTRVIQGGGMVKFTTIPNQGHCCWNTNYDPNYKESGLSIYDWMLQFPGNLPLTWGYFRYNSSSNKLEWSTQVEENVDHFEIEESDDGSNWETIGQVLANNKPSQYEFSL